MGKTVIQAIEDMKKALILKGFTEHLKKIECFSDSLR
jgi:hypothetical protein